MTYRRYLDVLSLVKKIAEGLGWTPQNGMTASTNVFRIVFSERTLRISVYLDYKERSLAKAIPVIFLEDEQNVEWYGKISFQRMTDEQICSSFAYFIAQFKKEQRE